jgi:hypothetical protein
MTSTRMLRQRNRVVSSDWNVNYAKKRCVIPKLNEQAPPSGACFFYILGRFLTVFNVKKRLSKFIKIVTKSIDSG